MNFVKKWDFKYVNFWINWGFLSPCDHLELLPLDSEFELVWCDNEWIVSNLLTSSSMILSSWDFKTSYSGIKRDLKGDSDPYLDILWLELKLDVECKASAPLHKSSLTSQQLKSDSEWDNLEIEGPEKKGLIFKGHSTRS